MKKPLRQIRQYRLPQPKPEPLWEYSVCFDETGTYNARELASLSAGNLSNAGEWTVGLLTRKAKASDAIAAWGLMRLAIQATKELTHIAESNPELLRPYSRSRYAWPVMKWKREKLSNAEKELFSKLGAAALGKLAKMHFRTALRAQNLSEPPKTEWQKSGGSKKI